MSREIRFRAWDETAGLLFNWDIVKNFKMEMLTKKQAYDNLTLHFFVFMQYTGFKDKNGNNIYEGDILKNNTTDVVEKCFVIFYGGSFSGKGIPEGHCGNRYFKEYKIIGNIYENPELLA